MMMSKRPSLGAALERARAGEEEEREREQAPALPPMRKPFFAGEEAAAGSGGAYVAPSRRGKKAITGHFDPAVAKQLKRLALEEDASIQALLSEALNDLFRKRGKNPIA